MSKKPLTINLRESLDVGPRPSPLAPVIDADSFLKGDKARSLPLARILRDQAAQPRLRLDPPTVEAYREAMAAADAGPGWGAFPPVVVFAEGESYWLADGFHRVAAAEAAGLAAVRAEVRPGGLREAILHSVGANAAHGLRRTNDDKRRAVVTLLSDPDWSRKSDRWIAEKAAVSHVFVGKLRAELGSTGNGVQSTERVGRDGRTLNTAHIGRSRGEPATGNRFQSPSAPLADGPEPASAVRLRRCSRSPAAFDALALAARQAAIPPRAKLPAHEVRDGLVALAAWAAGGDGKKARSFLRKLAIKPPREM